MINACKVPKERMNVTYFRGNKELKLEPDMDVKQILLDIGTAPNHMLPFGIKDNFWEMGAQRSIMGTEKCLIWSTLMIQICWIFKEPDISRSLIGP